MPITSFQSRSKSRSMLVGNSYFIPTAFESIATTTVGSGGSSYVEFTSIANTWTHLQIRGLVQTDRGTYGIDSIQIQLNSDTGSNYATHWLFGDGGSASVSAITSNTYLRPGDGQIGTSTGNSSLVFGGAVIDILDYKNTNKYKTVRALQGVDLNGTVAGIGGRIGIGSGVWMSTNAITSIKLYPQAGSNWNQYSSFALYGIKGS
jgi:hypothetical protein